MKARDRRLVEKYRDRLQWLTFNDTMSVADRERAAVRIARLWEEPHDPKDHFWHQRYQEALHDIGWDPHGEEFGS